jgi:hypothetical protein
MYLVIKMNIKVPKDMSGDVSFTGMRREELYQLPLKELIFFIMIQSWKSCIIDNHYSLLNMLIDLNDPALCL